MWRFISAVIHNTRSANMYEVHTFYFLSPSIPGAAWYGLAFSSPYVLTCYFSEKEMLNANVHVSFSAIHKSFSLYKPHLSNYIITYVLVELHNCLMMEEHEICLIFVQICKGRTNRIYVSSRRNRDRSYSDVCCTFQ